MSFTSVSNHTWICSPVSSKSHLLTPGGRDGKCSFSVKVPVEGRLVVLPANPKLPEGFQQSPLGGEVREGLPRSVIKACTILLLVEVNSP